MPGPRADTCLLTPLPTTHPPLAIGCAVNAACINTPGSFTCQCRLTYSGSGRAGDCAADPAAQAAVLGLFRTYADGDGNLLRSNKQGDGFAFVPYPQTAPGWNPDPTGEAPGGFI